MNIAVRLINMKMFLKVGRIIEIAFSRKYLLYTNLGISMGLSGVGDMLEQSHEIYKGELERWNHVRTNHMAVSGVAVGLLTHYWYKFLDKRMPGNSIQLVMRKVVADQVMFSPLSIFTFFVTLAILDGVSYSDFILECKEKAWRLYAFDCAVWPPAQFINFYFLPTRYRVIYDSTISLGFDVYASYVVHAIPLANTQDS